MLSKLFSLPSILIQLGVLTIFSTYLFPKYHEPIKAVATKKYQTLDVKIGYDKPFVIDLFENIGEKGRLQYARIEKELDLIFPILYTLFFYSLINYLCIKTGTINPSKFSAFVLIGAFADLGENTIILYCLNTFPNDIPAKLVSFGSILTIIKITSICLSAITIIGLITKNLIRRQ